MLAIILFWLYHTLAQDQRSLLSGGAKGSYDHVGMADMYGHLRRHVRRIVRGHVSHHIGTIYSILVISYLAEEWATTCHAIVVMTCWLWH